MQVTEHIYQVLGSPYANIANIFVVQGPEGLVLIDCAETKSDFEQICANMRAWDLDPNDITHVLISHKHLGHIGNLKTLKDMGVVVVAGDGDSDAIEQGIENEYCDYGAFPLREEYHPCKVDIRIKEDQTLELAGLTFEVTCVPGHTDGSLFFSLEIDREKVIFTGDVVSVNEDCSGAYLGWQGGIDYDRGKFFESIKKISQMKCDILLPGHFQCCMKNGTAILRDTYRVALVEWRYPNIPDERLGRYNLK